MERKRFLELMEFPKEWVEWDMLPKALEKLQVEGYVQGHEKSSEHDRNGAFQWWIKKNPPMTPQEMEKLYKLTYLDPDQIMASDVRGYIRKLPGFSDIKI